MKETTSGLTSTDGFVLSVLTGPNAGASVSLDTGHYTLGGGADSDVVLAGLRDCSVGVVLKGNFVSVKPQVDGVEVSFQASKGFVPLSVAGEPRLIRLPVRIRLAQNVLVALTGNQIKSPSRSRIFAGIGLVTLAVCFWLSDTVFRKTPNASPTEPAITVWEAPSELNNQLQKTAASYIQNLSPKCSTPDCIGRAKDVLKRRLEARGLINLTLRVDNGILRLGGTLLPEQFDIWQQIRTSLEAEFGQNLPIVASISSESTLNTVVSSVWLGENAEVRTQSGNVYQIGSKTPDGWAIQKIERDKVVFERNGRLVTVPFLESPRCQNLSNHHPTSCRKRLH